MKNLDNQITSKWSAAKIFGGVATAFMFCFGSAAVAQDYEPVSNTEVDAFTEWDADANEMWDENEFNSSLGDRGVFNDWDTDDDGFNSQEEFGTGLFNQWDEDENGELDYDEYSAGNSAWEDDFGDNFSEWDTNDDNTIDTEEYNAGLNDTGVYNEWDTDQDGNFNEEEFNSGLFSSADEDEDGFLNDNEYNKSNYDAWYEDEDLNNETNGVEEEGALEDVEKNEGEIDKNKDVMENDEGILEDEDEVIESDDMK